MLSAVCAKRARCAAWPTPRVPQRKRLAHRHQRHPRDHQAHVRFAGGKRGVGRARPDAHARDGLRARAGNPKFQAARLLARHREIRDCSGPIRRRLSAARFQEGRRRTRSRRSRLGPGRGRSGRGCLPGKSDCESHGGKEGQLADRAAALRSDHVAARSERPLRILREAHSADRAGALRKAQNADLSADRFAGVAGRLHADRASDSRQSFRRPRRPRPKGAEERLGPA